MKYQRIVNEGKNFYPRVLEHEILGKGRNELGKHVEFARQIAWRHIHSWNPRSVRLQWEKIGAMTPQEDRIVVLCDFDFEMMRMVSALAGIHLDLSEIVLPDEDRGTR